MASQPIYQLYCELRDYKPKIWRRFQVLGNIKMSRLAYVLMTMYEMKASHQFCFEIPALENFLDDLRNQVGAESNPLLKHFEDSPVIRDRRVELLFEDDIIDDGDVDIFDACTTPLKRHLKKQADKLVFAYDYGDNWCIDITLEGISENCSLPGKEFPRVLEGTGYGIIENCGGIAGLTETASRLNTLNGNDLKEFCENLGMHTSNLTAFDINDMNFRIKKIPRIYADLYEYELEPTKQSLKLLNREYLQ